MDVVGLIHPHRPTSVDECADGVVGGAACRHGDSMLWGSEDAIAWGSGDVIAWGSGDVIACYGVVEM